MQRYQTDYADDIDICVVIERAKPVYFDLRRLLASELHIRVLDLVDRLHDLISKFSRREQRFKI